MNHGLLNSHMSNFFSFSKELLSGMTANAIGQAVTITIQLVSLPIYLSQWSIQEYGIWLMLTAIPVYFGLLDGGIAAVTMNKMTISVANGKYTEANSEFQMGLYVISLLVAGILLLTTIVLTAIKYTIHFEYTFPLFFLIITALINLYNGLIDGIYRSTNSYAKGTNLLSFLRIIEWGCGVIGLMMYGSILSVALGMFSGRVMGFICLSMYTAKAEKIYSWGISERVKDKNKDVFSLSLKYFCLVIGNAINLQGMVIVLGLFYSPSILAIYNVYRTMARVINQIIGALGHALWPMITKKYANGAKDELRFFITSWFFKCFLVSVFIGFLIFMFGNEILNVWARNKIFFDPILLLLVLITTTISASYNVLYMLAVATNNFYKLPVYYLLTYVGLVLLVVSLSFILTIKHVVLLSILAEVLIFYFLTINSKNIFKRMGG